MRHVFLLFDMRIELHSGFHLSPVQEGDQLAYVEHFSDHHTTERLLKIPYPYTSEDAERWVRFCLNSASQPIKPNQFAVRRADGFLVGGIGLQLHGGLDRHRAELGYWMAKDYRDRGLATAAARRMIRYAFDELGLSRIEATSSPHNIASHRVLEKSGFVRDGFLAAYPIKEGKPIDVDLFSIVDSGATSPF